MYRERNKEEKKTEKQLVERDEKEIVSKDI